ncbi:MAG: extensin family protein [Sphingomonadales bacterium]|nr:extensin family protein [Sphingomonadales bacterium]MBD3772513.1 extensin family protein [Paracoccaceae bacterium]
MRIAASLAALLALGACNMLPERHGGGKPVQAARAPVAVTADARQCLSELGTSGADFSALPDQYYGAGCSTLNTVRLDHLRGDAGQFALTNLGPVACPTANAFAAWARFGVDRAARQLLGSPLVRIETMGSYSCRNVAGTSRRSAHSQAQAIDVAAFVLADGRRISVLDDWNGGGPRERQFLRLVHQSACKRFGTVLGPDYNADHRNHFHLEQGGSSFCR